MFRPAVIALALVAALPANASSRHALVLARVSLAGLDLSTPKGAAEMLGRLKAAAHDLCDGPRSPVFVHDAAWRCRREAVSAAVERLNAPLLASAWMAELSAAPAKGP